MNVTVRCFAGLAAHQPDPPDMDLPEGSLVADVLARLVHRGLPPDAQTVVLLDGGPAGPDTPLPQGAALDILPMVDGG